MILRACPVAIVVVCLADTEEPIPMRKHLSMNLQSLMRIEVLHPAIEMNPIGK